MTAFEGFGELSRPIGRRVVLGGLGALSAGVDAFAMGRRPPRDAPDQTRWTFDRLTNIGGFATTVEGEMLHWKRGDVIVVPSWQQHAHHSNDGAVLFRTTDEPVMQKLGFMRDGQ